MKLLRCFSAVAFGVLFLIAGMIGNVSAQQRDSVTYAGVTYYLPSERGKIALPANLPETITVVSGDTLWDLSRVHLKDPFLWPLIWEANLETVTNPHLIYPSQVLKFPKGGAFIPALAGGSPSTLPTGEIIYDETGARIPQRIDGDMTVEEYLESYRVQLGTPSELEKCGYIRKQDDGTTVGSIISSENPASQLSFNDIVYLDLGENDNVKAGDVFSVITPARKVYHPHTKKYFGELILTKGRVQVLCTQDNASTALIIKAYDAIYVGDKLTPYIPAVPKSRDETTTQDICTKIAGELTCHIIDVRSGGNYISEGVLIATDDIVYLDKGSADGVAAGQYYNLYRYNTTESKRSSFQRINTGELIVLAVNDFSSTALVTKALTYLSIGDIADLHHR